MDLRDELLAEFLELVDPEAFAAQLNTKFRVDGADVELIEVSERRSSPLQQAFSMLFRFPSDFPPMQASYRFEHSVLGAKEIFVVPIGQDRDGMLFEAVFNRLLPKEHS